MEMHNIINISSTNIKKWFNNINNEIADLLFKKCYEFKLKRQILKLMEKYQSYNK